MDVAHRGVDPVQRADPRQEPANPRALARDIVQAARTTGALALVASYERTLRVGVPGERSGGLSLLVRGALVALAATPCTRIVITSGQDARDLERQVNVPGVIYAGCGGLQVRGAGLNACHPATAQTTAMWPVLARELADRVDPLASVEVEAKELGVTIHLRRAAPCVVPAILAHVDELRRVAAFRVQQADAAIHLLPDVNWREGSRVPWFLEEWVRQEPDQPAALVYLGDEERELSAHAAGTCSGYAIHVGQRGCGSGEPFWVADQAAAADLLARIAFAWGAGSPSR